MTESVVQSRLPSIRRFNPAVLQSDQAVIDQFVVRHHELSIAMDVLRSNIDAPSSQHALVVGPRGRGKTMLLARVAAEIRADAALSRHLLAVRFMEENQEVYGLGEFWLETLFQLASAVGHRDAAVAAELRERHAALAGQWRDQALADLARAAVLDVADRVGCRLVLMIENFQSLCLQAESDFGWQLRQVLQSVPEIILLGSATSRFQALDDAEEPFFELFRLIELGPLNTEDCRRLWEMARGEPVFASDVRPLQILTGGSPRFLVFLAGFAQRKSLRSLMEELVTIIDQHTEYFRGHLDSLPRGERRVFIALIDLWTPSTAGEIGARARMDIRVVSTMLARLINRGAVLKDPDSPRRGRLYAAAEPLYSIYYKLRRERDEAVVVESLVHFMVALYEVGTFWRLRDSLAAELAVSASFHAGFERALDRRPANLDMTARMKWDAVEEIVDKARDRRSVDAELRLDEEIREAIDQGAWEELHSAIDRYVAAVGPFKSVDNDHDAVYFADLRTLAYLNTHEFAKVIEIAQQTVNRFRKTRNGFVWFRSLRVLLNQAAAHFALRDYPAAIAAASELSDWLGDAEGSDADLLRAQSQLYKARGEEAQGNLDAAASRFDHLLIRYGRTEEATMETVVVRALLHYAEALRKGRRETQRVIELYDDATSRIERLGSEGLGDDEFLRLATDALLNGAFVRAGAYDFDGEMCAYRKLIALLEAGGTPLGASEAAVAQIFLNMRLSETGGAEEALASHPALLDRIEAVPNDTREWFRWCATVILATALTARGEGDAARTAIRQAIAAFRPDHELATRLVIRFVTNLLAVGATETELVDILTTEPAVSESLAPLIVALRHAAGEAVRAPAEMVAVAADIRRGIAKHAADGVPQPW